MADSVTVNYGLTKPEVGASNDSWGNKQNAGLDLIDATLFAISAIANLANTTAAAALPQAQFTAAAILARLLTVDGTGSGLDADLLDGKHANEFVFTSAYTAADVLAKLLTVDGASSGLDADLLDGQQGSFYTAIVDRLGYTPANLAGAAFTGPISGTTATFSGDVTSSSDERLKTEIEDLDGAAMLAALKMVRGQSFLLGTERKVGVIAQKVESAGLSELVTTHEKNGFKSVNYAGLTAPLIAAIVHLAARVEELEKRYGAAE